MKMKILTKKDLKKEFGKEKVKGKKPTKDKPKMDELVDDSGALIDGDENNGTDIVNTGWNNPQTSREFSRKTSQGPRYYYSPNYGHQYYREGVEDKTTKSNDISENRMKTMIEDIMRKSSYGDMDFVNRYDDYGVKPKGNDIPSFTELKVNYQKPILARKMLFLGDLMKKENIGGEELSIILNHFLNIMSDVEIPNQYKKGLIEKIKNGKLKTEE